MSEVERTGENWTQGGGRKGKEAERDEVERTGENWTQGRGRKGKEAEIAKGGATPLREKMSEVERTGRKEGEGSGARRRDPRGPRGVYPGKPGP